MHGNPFIARANNGFMLKKSLPEGGFTLLELIIALAIILLGTLALIKSQHALLQCLNANSVEWNNYEKIVALPVTKSACEKDTSSSLPLLSCEIQSKRTSYHKPYLD